MRPIAIPTFIKKQIEIKNSAQATIRIKENYSRFLLKDNSTPDISIIIPAYNEEENILHTLSSLCENNTSKTVEIIVVNNNSTDNTEQLVKDCGVTCIKELKQGITNARNAGLAIARGKYILNADADTIYPIDWIEEMTKPLSKDNVAATYGRFSFIPLQNTSRLTYFFYEYIADLSRVYNKYFKDEAVNVYGFNSGFKRENGLAVEGFNHPPGTNEDGWLALKLRNKGFGKIHQVTATKALVWTTDRRILIDGGLIKGSLKRIKRIIIKK